MLDNHINEFELSSQKKEVLKTLAHLICTHSNFSFVLNSKQNLGLCRCEFIISFMKKNGQQADKIFKISEADIKSCNKTFTKAFSFKPISTRKYYPGEHKLTLVVNGKKLTKQSFVVLP